MCGVDEDTRVLRSDDGLNDRGNVIDIRQCLDTEEDIIVGCFGRFGSLIGSSDDCRESSVPIPSSQRR